MSRSLADTSDPATWISSQEVARRIKRSPSLIPVLVAQGRITPKIKGPGRTGPYLFDPVEVDAYIKHRDGLED